MHLSFQLSVHNFVTTLDDSDFSSSTLTTTAVTNITQPVTKINFGPGMFHAVHFYTVLAFRLPPEISAGRGRFPPVKEKRDL